MEVDAVSFPHHLLGILIAISEADFVSFDLEYSGIPNRMPGRPPRQDAGRQTLEDRYLETKAGAEKYAILQVGITCGRFDYIANKYILRPYNVNLSPLLDERLNIERDVTFQTGAVTFLMNNGFQMDLPWTRGVPYLSRDEAEWARQHAYDRAEKKHPMTDIQLEETDVDSLNFVQRVRAEIDKFDRSNRRSLEITTHTGLEEQPPVSKISNFEKRLVYQLVRASYEDKFVAIGKSNCILIIDKDPIREQENVAKQKRWARERINKNTGFRWVFEALVGGNIDSIDPFYFAQNPNGMVIAADIDNIRNRFGRAAERLKTRQPVLVGHNMFTDLVYLYQCFQGKLPDTLKEFQKEIHKLLPRIVDTKYLATFAGGDLNVSPTLQEIAEGLEQQELPEIVTHRDHTKYHDTEAFHEAGYDSLLTATIMLRLSTKLDVEIQEKLAAIIETESAIETDSSFRTALEEPESEGGISLIVEQAPVVEPATLPPAEDSWTTTPTPTDPEPEPTPETVACPVCEKHVQSVLINEHIDSSCETHAIEDQSMWTTIPSNADPGPESDHDAGHSFEPVERKKKEKSKSKKKKTKKKETAGDHSVDGKFVSQNAFEHLRLSDQGDYEWEAVAETPTESGRAAWQDEKFVQDKTGWVPIETMTREPMELLPDFDSDFWQEFGNKLRIFGTKELILKIADWPVKTETE